MTRETDLIATLGISRTELRHARQHGGYETPADWLLVGKAICWTESGRKRLEADLGVESGLSDGEKRVGTVLPGRVLNPRLVRMAVQGEDEPQVVYVGNNRLYRPGMEAQVWYEGNGWKARAKPIPA